MSTQKKAPLYSMDFRWDTFSVVSGIELRTFYMQGRVFPTELWAPPPISKLLWTTGTLLDAISGPPALPKTKKPKPLPCCLHTAMKPGSMGLLFHLQGQSNLSCATSHFISVNERKSHPFRCPGMAKRGMSCFSLKWVGSRSLWLVLTADWREAAVTGSWWEAPWLSCLLRPLTICCGCSLIPVAS